MKFRRVFLSLAAAALVALPLTASQACSGIECVTNGGGSGATGYSFTTLDFFRVPSANPVGTLIQANDGNLYGTLFQGGLTGSGSIFRITTAGTFTTLHEFSDSDGRFPDAALFQGPDGNLYGTTLEGGANGDGAIFRITTSGTFTLLHSFSGSTEGLDVRCALILANDGNLWGTTNLGGANNDGTVFKLGMAGSGFTVMHAFDSTSVSDGGSPRAGLFQATDGNLYGTSEFGGANGYGTVFRITTGGTFTVMHSFTSTDGSDPRAGVFQASDGNLWGSTYTGGSSSVGTVFKMSTTGTFTSVHSFAGATTDGANPRSTPIQASDGNLYATTEAGGANDLGTVYKLTTAGVLTTILSLDNTTGAAPIGSVVQGTDGLLYMAPDNSGPSLGGSVIKLTLAGAETTLKTFGDDAPNGTNPFARLVDGGDGFFYGSTEWGGTSNIGTVFRVSSTGSAFTVLHTFTGSDGARPLGGLVKGSDGNFYGTTDSGGANGLGTVFKITPGGSFSLLHSFTGTDGASPDGPLVQVAATGLFYGTTFGGGTYGDGTIFSIGPTGTFSSLHSLNSGVSEGSQPYDAAMVLASDGFLYGTTEHGGASGYGSVFRITTSGTFTTLTSFTGGSDGAYPVGGLVQASEGNLYGTTYSNSGVNNVGLVYQVTTGGTLTTLHTFAGTDGSYPFGELLKASDGSLYGTTQSGGSGSSGTVYNITTSGTFSTVHSFGGADGFSPYAGLVSDSSGAIYGTTYYGGLATGGTVFKISKSAPASGGGGGGSLPAPMLALFALAAALRRRRR